ncbi:hypothetical protein [Clostridium minihomine]|uniref:hypothetical protein n=1 Tax=Clostridium minihomine TaxID=2045012 RepID=UPI000C7708DB|nr:hypothetical protein [Clostridium minihomine]
MQKKNGCCLGSCGTFLLVLIFLLLLGSFVLRKIQIVPKDDTNTYPSRMLVKNQQSPDSPFEPDEHRILPFSLGFTNEGVSPIQQSQDFRI